MSKRTYAFRIAPWIMLAAAAVAAIAADAAESPRIHPAIQAAIDSPDRPAQDRQFDSRRQYAPLFEFIGVHPGMKVLELFAGPGITAELLARTVGPEGTVLMQNPPWYYEYAGQKEVEARLANNRLPNVVRLDKPLNEMQLEANSLDGAVAHLVLHDFFWLSDDVPGVLRDIHSALKPGGWFAVVDHSAPAGTGADYAKDRDNGPHRIDEAYVKQLVTAAGFTLAAQTDLLRNPDDDRSKAFFAPELRGKTTDRFVLKFVKP